jgi:tetratricopeptide (TPR) repeat protein
MPKFVHLTHLDSLMTRLHRPQMVHITPVAPPIEAAGRLKDDGLYADAAHLIEAKQYAAALELLQQSRDKEPNDVRVLNAFGVVYDKLGRFDLSTRYYNQAEALDPASPIVKQNQTYSAMLQAAAQGQPQPQLAAARPAALAAATPAYRPGSGGGVVQVSPHVLRIESLPAPTEVVLAKGSGHPLLLVDATGVHNAAEPLRTRLVSLGWTAAPATTAPLEAQSRIVYAAAAEPAARALARTLAVKVRMDACQDACEGVRLILGADSLKWPERKGPHGPA